jgi:hypothetical protein
MKIKPFLILLLSIILVASESRAQQIENDYQIRTGVEFGFNPLKKLTISISPEIRFDKSFSPDKYLIETDAAFKVNKYLKIGAGYRFEINPRNNKSTQYLNRYSFDALAKKKINRFTPSLRLRFSNYSDDENISDGNAFLRYKTSVKYDIPKSKLRPVVSAELFHQLSTGAVYKMRYSAGVNYKFSKKNSIGLAYKFDYFYNEYRNKHVLGLTFKRKF